MTFLKISTEFYLEDYGIQLNLLVYMSQVGQQHIPSSLIMNAVPAIVAGVKRIVITVPAINGVLNPVILACANLLGIKEIYKIGGAQAVAALAIGTKKLKKLIK